MNQSAESNRLDALFLMLAQWAQGLFIPLHTPRRLYRIPCRSPKELPDNHKNKIVNNVLKADLRFT